MTDAFLAAFRGHPAGAAILTADPGGGPVALTVSSLISVSAAPPMVAFSLSGQSSSARALGRADALVIHFVRRADTELARRCAQRGSDRFGAGTRWERLPTGEPYYPEVKAWFRATVRGRLAVAGADLVVAELLDGAPNADQDAGEAIVYLDRAWHAVGPRVDAGRAPLVLWPDDSATF
jgi:flavin reductase (DIM6/NTAB) family NADH-FMN oxidoreductase RutF